MRKSKKCVMVNFYLPDGHKSQHPFLRQNFISLSKLFKGVVVFAAANLANPYIGTQGLKWLRDERSGQMQDLEKPSYFFFGQNRRVANQISQFTGRWDAPANDEGDVTGATYTAVRQLDDWAHTVNQHLIREMKSRIKKRWHLRRFNREAVPQEGVVKDTGLSSIKPQVYDRDGRSLVYYYHSIAEGQQLNDTQVLSQIANIVSGNINVHGDATGLVGGGGSRQFRNVWMIRELQTEGFVGSTDAQKIQGGIHNPHHKPFVKIFAKDDRADWDGTPVDLDDLLFAYKLTEYNHDNSYILNFLEDQFQKVESTLQRYTDVEDIVRISGDTFNQTLRESDKNWLILFINNEYWSDNQEGAYGEFRLKCAELQKLDNLNIQCARTNQWETGLYDLYLGAYDDWVNAQWDVFETEDQQFWIPKLVFLPASLYTRAEHSHYTDRQIYDFIHELTPKNVTQVLENIEDGTFFIDEEALLLQEQQEQQDIDFEEGLATKKQDDIKVSQEGKKIDASRFQMPSKEKDDDIQLVTDPNAVSGAIWAAEKETLRKEEAKEHVREINKHVKEDNDYDFDFESSYPEYDENDENEEFNEK